MTNLIKHRIFVEGLDDRKFILAFLKMAGVDSKILEEFLQIIIITGGITKLSNHPEFFHSKSRTDAGGMNLVIFDTDDKNADFGGRENRLDYLSRVISEKSEFTKIYLFPDNKSEVGTLETLVESCINHSNEFILQCWNKYIDCLDQGNRNLSLPDHHSKIYSYFSVLSKYYQVKENGASVEKRDYSDSGLFNFDFNKNAGLIELKNFLEKYLK